MTMDCLRAIAEKAGGFENITGLVFHDSVILENINLSIALTNPSLCTVSVM